MTGQDNHLVIPESAFKFMHGSRKFCQRGSNFEKVSFLFYFFLEGREDPNKYHYKRAIIDSPAKRHLNAFCWQADDGPTLNAGLVAL